MIDWLRNSNSDLVFHYTRMTTALKNILPSGHIQFGNMCHSNDPYERSLWNISPAVWGGSENEASDSLKEAASIREIIHKRSRTFCTVKDSGDSQHFGRGYMNFPLWWHYADENKGICFAFDKSKLQETVSITANARSALFTNHSDVSYDLGSCDLFPVFNPTIPLTNDNNLMTDRILKNIKRFKKKIFFTKDSSWITENEFRFVVICNDDMPFNIDYSDSIIGIILGCEFPTDDIQQISQLLTKLNINAAFIDIYNGKPELYELDKS